jgi:hypothetical protein
MAYFQPVIEELREHARDRLREQIAAEAQSEL